MPGSPRTDLGEGFVRSAELLRELQKDIADAYEALEQRRESQFHRRIVVRAIFSFIEAAVEAVKNELRSSIRCGEFTLPMTDRDKETLGSIHVVGPRKDKFLPLDQNVKRTFRLATKIWSLKGFALDTSGGDFQDFLLAKSARNRLTHPKTFYDIEVTESDMHCHMIAGMWIQIELGRLHEARIRTLSERLPYAERENFIQSFVIREQSTGNASSAYAAATDA